MEEFLIRGGNLILPGCGATSTLARGATLTARWFRELQPISKQPVALRFPHRAGQYRPRVSPFSSPVSWSCKYMEQFLIRGWDPILPGCGGTSTLARGEISPRAGPMSPSRSPSRSTISQWGWGFHTVEGGIDPGDLRFRPPLLLDVQRHGMLSYPGMRLHPPQVRRDLDDVPGGSFRRALAL